MFIPSSLEKGQAEVHTSKENGKSKQNRFSSSNRKHTQQKENQIQDEPSTQQDNCASRSLDFNVEDSSTQHQKCKNHSFESSDEVKNSNLGEVKSIGSSVHEMQAAAKKTEPKSIINIKVFTITIEVGQF